MSNHVFKQRRVIVECPYCKQDAEEVVTTGRFVNGIKPYPEESRRECLFCDPREYKSINLKDVLLRLRSIAYGDELPTTPSGKRIGDDGDIVSQIQNYLDSLTDEIE